MQEWGASDQQRLSDHVAQCVRIRLDVARPEKMLLCSMREKRKEILHLQVDTEEYVER